MQLRGTLPGLNGRMPSEWAGREIAFRVPYTMHGELIIASGETGQQYPEATFMNNVDKPFEIHRVIPRVTALDENGDEISPQPDQDELQAAVRVSIFDTGKNQNITKNPSLLRSITKGSSERTWEWADPYYLVRSESLQTTLDALAFPTAWNAASLCVEIDYQGFLTVVAPPSERR